MARLKWSYITFSFLLLGMVLFAWLYQASFWINWDVSWDLLVTQKLLNGGTYSHDFFDFNPPLVFFLYSPIIFMSKIPHITLDLALRLYIFGLSVFSLMVCQLFLCKIFSNKDRLIGDLLLIAFAFIFLVAPGYEFGEREHLMLILTMPYFLAVVFRMQGNTLNPVFGIAIGLMAFLGFSMKPYFMVSLTLVEIYLMCQWRTLFAVCRSETLTIGIAFIFYILFIYRYFPDYIQIILPMTLRYYHNGFTNRFLVLCSYTPIYICWIGILFNLLFIKKLSHPYLNIILLLAFAGFLASYFMQHTSWFYHLLPAYAVSLLLCVYTFGSLVAKRLHRLFLFVLGIWILCTMSWMTYKPYVFMKDYKENYGELVTFIDKHADNQSLMVLSAMVTNLFPTAYYGNASVGSRFLHLFWMPGLVRQSAGLPLKNVTPQQLKDQETLINDVAEDLRSAKPKFVFVDVQRDKTYFAGIPFDYLPYFLTNAQFKAAWTHYHYFTTLQKFKYSKGVNRVWYQLAVYERDNG